jgi:hypothetical protein
MFAGLVLHMLSQTFLHFVANRATFGQFGCFSNMDTKTRHLRSPIRCTSSSHRRVRFFCHDLAAESAQICSLAVFPMLHPSVAAKQTHTTFIETVSSIFASHVLGAQCTVQPVLLNRCAANCRHESRWPPHTAAVRTGVIEVCD